MQGGVKVYRGSAAAARTYVEADRSRADDYYLAEGSGLAERYVAWNDGLVWLAPVMDGDTYERWVAGYQVDTRQPKGRLRTDDHAVRFLEVIVNGPKTWSLAATVDPAIASAYEKAQDRAAQQIVSYLAAHATTRVGPRGRQVQVPIDTLEAAVVRHRTSRAGDPHWHLHLQISARVWSAERWRGLHIVGVRDMTDAINGIGHAAVLCDPSFRAAVESRGYHFAGDGEIAELGPYAGPFSARAAQVRRHMDRYEAKWRTEHPGEEPGPRLRERWDRRAWAHQRPDKVVAVDGLAMRTGWVEELTNFGFTPPTTCPEEPQQPSGEPAIDFAGVTEVVLARLAKRRSAWNTADIRGLVERRLAETGVIHLAAERIAVAESLTSHVADACVPLLNRDDVPEHIRNLTSPHVLTVEDHLTRRLTRRADPPPRPPRPRRLDPDGHSGLDPTQRRVVDAISGHAPLVIVEGAAGAGKTTTLTAARAELETQGCRLIVVTPTLKAAEVAERQVGTGAYSAAWLVHQHGFRWDEDDRWTRDPDAVDRGPSPAAQLRFGDVLLVDEAGMVNQDLALALATVADESRARLVLMGDRHQLPAVGRGGAFQIAARLATPDGCLTLDRVHRFTDPDYAALSLDMRAGRRSSEVFNQLLAKGQVVIHASEVERATHVASECADRILVNPAAPSLLLAETREQVADLNAAIRDHLVTAGHVDDHQAVTTRIGQRIGRGDHIATRKNDRALQVANRDTWTVAARTDHGGLLVRNCRRERTLPPNYVHSHVELAYASTVHAAQGDTVDHADVLLSDHSTAAAAYVAMTRGRHANVAHLVADSAEAAREQWVSVFAHDRADLGPAAAVEAAAEAIERYGTQARGQGLSDPQRADPTPHASPPRESPTPGISF